LNFSNGKTGWIKACFSIFAHFHFLKGEITFPVIFIEALLVAPFIMP